MTTISQTAPIRPRPNHARKRRIRSVQKTILLWLAFLPLVIIVIIPIIYMVTMAFTLESNQANYPIQWVPSPPTVNNFIHIFVDATLPIGRWFLNSLVVSVAGTVFTVFLSSLSGYAFARLDFPGKNFFFSLLLVSLMIPIAITLIPTFLLLRDLNLLDTYFAILLPAGASVIGVFLMRQHFYSIPGEIEDAARVDGANRFRIYWQICMPMVTGAITALSIFTFLFLWNDLFWPLIVLGKREMYTLPVGLLFIQQGSYIQRGLAYAGAFIASTPALIFYAIFQRRIISGVTMTGMAGQ